MGIRRSNQIRANGRIGAKNGDPSDNQVIYMPALRLSRLDLNPRRRLQSLGAGKSRQFLRSHAS